MTTLVTTYLLGSAATLLGLLWALPRYAGCTGTTALLITGATAVVLGLGLLGLLRVLRGTA